MIHIGPFPEDAFAKEAAQVFLDYNKKYNGLTSVPICDEDLVLSSKTWHSKFYLLKTKYSAYICISSIDRRPNRHYE